MRWAGHALTLKEKLSVNIAVRVLLGGDFSLITLKIGVEERVKEKFHQIKAVELVE